LKTQEIVKKIVCGVRSGEYQRDSPPYIYSHIILMRGQKCYIVMNYYNKDFPLRPQVL